MSEILSITPKNSVPGSQSKNELGERGEKLAADHLRSLGYAIIVTNFRVPIGRNSKGVQVTGEIDIVALDGDILCFAEVKTRSSEDFAPVLSAIDARKQRQIIRTARVYRKLFSLRDMTSRYDAVTVVIPPGGPPQIELSKGFWNEGKFKKRRWSDDGF